MSVVCFNCGKELTEEDKKQMVGLDTPYLNIFFCKPFCWSVANSQDLNTYLYQNIEKVYNMLVKSNEKGNNDKQRRKIN
jgi:hypothetical protein